MKINDNYEIAAVDERTIAVFKRRVSKKGTPEESIVWNPIAYFSTVKDALKYFVKHEINGTGLKDLIAVYEKINELENLILAFYARSCDEVIFNERLEQIKESGVERKDIVIKHSDKQRRSPPKTPAAEPKNEQQNKKPRTRRKRT